MPDKTNNQYIHIRGARTNNLKNISISIPKNKFVVISGVSGSGKSSLAFDTIFAEGQRRYVDSLSNYAKQFVNILDKPDVDQIEGLSPAISIDQKSVSKNPRSTVGTITEIYDYLKLLFARVGTPYCPNCKTKIKKQSFKQILEEISKLDKQNTSFIAPIIKDKEGDHKKILKEIKKANFDTVIFDNIKYNNIEALINSDIEIEKKHTIEIIIDEIIIDKNKSEHIAQILKKTLDLGDGVIKILANNKIQSFSQKPICPKCNIEINNLEPRIFSFNSPYGACQECFGLGKKQKIDPELLIPNKKLSIAEGAIRPLIKTHSNNAKIMRALEDIGKKYNFSINDPAEKMTVKQLDIIFHGSKNEPNFEGIINLLNKKYIESDSIFIKTEIEKYMRTFVCQKCHGQRLKPAALSVKLAEKNIAQIVSQTIKESFVLFSNIHKKLGQQQKIIATELLKEICSRLHFLVDVGLDYLTLDRSADTLSGGEAQRVKLATQISSQLSGVIYVLDEPTIGLHEHDSQKLISTLKNLRDLKNTVIVVEHDRETILSSDFVIDVGPHAGKYGGKIIAKGTVEEIKKNKNSITGNYLSGRFKVPYVIKQNIKNNKFLEIKKASEFNLKNIDVKFPLNKFICVTGVSGSGKSTLITEILAKALARYFYKSKDLPGKHKQILGLEHINKVITIDQSSIGKTPRSNPATYTGLFTLIRDLYTELPESKMRDLKAGHFSFNVPGGRCENCKGEGVIKIEMNFMPDVYIECEECHGKRYNKKILEIHYKEKNIAEILEMTSEEATSFFKGNQPVIYNKLKILCDVGLGYIQLGQSAPKLSGGEAQRIKLATELSRRDTGKTLYILDEPTTGLHFEDIKNLLAILNKLVEKGNTVIVIEHNMDIIKSADWVIDLGPEGGDKGGKIVAEGTPQDVAKTKKSYTGQYLNKILNSKF
ncbi:MAG: excinuclease ABC subunit UvrA [Patescibacteria group bacterium]